jgi:hypothetical protein
VIARRLIGLALPAALAACSGSIPEACEQIDATHTIQNAAGEDTTVFSGDERVYFALAVTNEGKLPIEVSLTDCSPLTYEVQDASGTPQETIACPIGESLCDCASPSLTLDPGEGLTWRYGWNQRPNGGTANELVPAGEYTGMAFDATGCAPKLDSARTFTLIR